MRSYTVKEIDQLRRACENKYLYGVYDPWTNRMKSETMLMSRSYNEQDKYRAVEEMVRTHMLAGHTAQDLMESENGT